MFWVFLFVIAILLFGLAGWLVLSGLMSLGWKIKYNEAMKAANYNARQWADAELRASQAELREAELRGALTNSGQLYNRMSEIAGEAIKQAGGNAAKSEIDDSVLDAGEIQ